MIVYAVSEEATQAAETLLGRINDVILFPLMTLMTSVAIVFFLWGAFQFIAKAGDESARTTGRRHMMYGVIGLFVMLTAFTILNVAAGTFGLSASN